MDSILWYACKSAPAVALASGLLCPVAQGAPGDLDPAFSVGGRAGPLFDLRGPAWAVESLDDGGAVFVGGNLIESECDNSPCDDRLFSGFAGHLSSTGSVDAHFAAADISHSTPPG